MNYVYVSILRRNPKLERMNGWNLITSSLPTLTLIILEILFLFWEALPRLFVSYVNQSQISFLCGYFSVLLRSAAIWSPKAFPVLILIRSMLIHVCRQSDPRNEQGWHLQTEWWYFSHCCSCCMIPLLFSIFRITPAALMTLQWAEVRLWDTSSAPLKVFNQHSFDGVGTSIYHTGDTAIFGDMSLISAIYKPSVCLMCIGDNYTMGTTEAAYALNHVFHHQSLWCD